MRNFKVLKKKIGKKYYNTIIDDKNNNLLNNRNYEKIFYVKNKIFLIYNNKIGYNFINLKISNKPINLYWCDELISFDNFFLLGKKDKYGNIIFTIIDFYGKNKIDNYTAINDLRLEKFKTIQINNIKYLLLGDKTSFFYLINTINGDIINLCFDNIIKIFEINNNIILLLEKINIKKDDNFNGIINFEKESEYNLFSLNEKKLLNNWWFKNYDFHNNKFLLKKEDNQILISLEKNKLIRKKCKYHIYYDIKKNKFYYKILKGLIKKEI